MPDYRIGKLGDRFVVSWWEDGKRRRYRLDARTAKGAESEAIDVIRRETAKEAPVTVKQLWDWYCEEKAGKRAVVAMGYEWKHLGPHFGHLRPDQIEVETCRAYTAGRRATMLRRKSGELTPVNDGTIWTELGHLRTVMVWAAEKRHLIPRAPSIERPAKPAAKDRWLNDAEIAKLMDAKAAPHVRLAIQLMLGTAARVTAALELTWDRVHFDTGVIDLRVSDATTRKGRAVVPMNSGLRAALQTAKAAALTDNVIEWAGAPVKSIKTGFNLAVKDAGLVGVTPHVLRHTAAVHMAAAGRPMSKIAQYLGHTSTAVTERVYARYAPDHLQEEADVLDFASRLRVVGTKSEGKA